MGRAARAKANMKQVTDYIFASVNNRRSQIYLFGIDDFNCMAAVYNVPSLVGHGEAAFMVLSLPFSDAIGWANEALTTMPKDFDGIQSVDIDGIDNIVISYSKEKPNKNLTSAVNQRLSKYGVKFC